MTRTRLALLATLSLLALTSPAQDMVGSFDASRALLTKPFRSVNFLPTTCTKNEFVILESAATGSNAYECGISNDWHMIAGSGSGTPGTPGSPGANGSNGTNGRTIWNGTAAPVAVAGSQDGDFYIDTVAHIIYGPRASGSWPGSGVSLVGSSGTPGTNGTAGSNGVNGCSLLSGTVNPTSQGVNCDYYLNTASSTLFGPRASGAWPGSGTVLSAPFTYGTAAGTAAQGNDARIVNPPFVNLSGAPTDNAALATALSNKQSNLKTFNVQDYGANGNVNTDSTNIASAIAAASTAGGGILYFPPISGCYKLNATMVLNVAGLIVRGAGDASCILAPLSSSSPINVTADGVLIQNIAIDGQYRLQISGSTTGSTGITFAANRLTVDSVYLHDVTGHGITGQGDDTVISNCRITNLGVAASAIQPVPAPTTTSFALSPGTAKHFTAGMPIRIGAQSGTISAVQAINSYVNVVTSATVFTLNPGDGALFTAGQVIHVGHQTGTIGSISGDVITMTAPLSGTPHPHQLMGVDNITLTSAITTPTAGNVVAVTGGFQKAIYIGSPVSRPVVKGSYIRGWSQAIGFWYPVSDELIEGNRIIDNYGYEDLQHTIFRSAVEIYPAQYTGTSGRVIGNLVDGSTSACFEIAQGTVGLSLVDNVCRNWGGEVGFTTYSTAGIGITGQTGQIDSNISISGGSIEANGVWGTIGFQLAGDSGSTNGISVNGVTFRNFASLNGATYAIIAGFGMSITGSAFDNCVYGIWSTADAGIITGNQFNQSPTINSGAAQIYLAPGASNWTITGNSITVNGGTGILLQNTSEITIANNVINAGLNPNSAAIYDTDSNDVTIQGNQLSSVGNYALRIRGTNLRNKVKGNSFAGYVTNELTSDYVEISGNTFPLSSDPIGDFLISSSGTHNLYGPNCSNGVCSNHAVSGGGTPTITSGFGTSPTLTTASTDAAGSLIVGSGGTAATGVITFAVPFVNVPACVANNNTTTLLAKAVPTATTLTITSASAFTAADILSWQCTGMRQ